MSNASTIRPGLLVSVKSTVVGGVSYTRVDLETGETPVQGTDVAEWKTKRVIEDKTEHEAAVKCRAKALGGIRAVCSATTFGLLCPNEQEGALDAAVTAARALVDAHNAIAKHTRVGVYVLKGRVASDDAEAARAITQEISSLVNQMDAGIESFNVDAIREAAKRAAEMSNMLSDDNKAKVEGAIEQARKAARMIVKRIEKEGEDRAIVIRDIQRGQIESARITFLDLSGDATPVEALPSVSAQRFADLDTSDVVLPETAQRQSIPLDFSDDAVLASEVK